MHLIDKIEIRSIAYFEWQGYAEHGIYLMVNDIHEFCKGRGLYMWIFMTIQMIYTIWLLDLLFSFQIFGKTLQALPGSWLSSLVNLEFDHNYKKHWTGIHVWIFQVFNFSTPMLFNKSVCPSVCPSVAVFTNL